MSGPFAAGLLPAHKKHDDAEFDITAMIDLVFLMNIYFMFLFITQSMSETPDLPNAVHAAPLVMDDAIQITVLASPDPHVVIVELDSEKGEQIRDPAAQESKIAAAVDTALAQKKTKVLIKAQKSVRLRETQRIAAAAGREGITLHVAVMESSEKPHK
jgi:biopolymer transport protein ExbD